MFPVFRYSAFKPLNVSDCKSTYLNFLTNVVVGLQFVGADVKMDVALSVILLGCEKVSGQGSNLLGPRR